MTPTKPVIVIGHKNPDTDSICAAICYAKLKEKLTGNEYVPCRAGQVNGETKYVLERFGVEAPRLVDSLEPRLYDVQYRQVGGISPHLSLKRAWEYMRDNNIQTIPVLEEHNQLRGILTLGDVARFYMEDQDANALAEAKTSYRNIVDALSGEMVVGDIDSHFTQGKVVVAAANPDVMEDYIAEHDMVILGNRYESQLCSIEMKAGCIIVGLGSKVSRTICKLAAEANCAIIASPLDTYACSKVINQAVPVRHVMRTKGLITFRYDDLVSDVKAAVSKKRVRYFPILDSSGAYMGLISQRNLLDMEHQQVILVDHNEKDQAVDGIRSAEVVEVIDHHRIDAVETSNPIYFRNQPLGCTCTIVALMYQENQVEIDATTAGLLCSAILSDTLMFRSPTCTIIDQQVAKMLAAIAGIDITEHATAMFNAGSRLGDRSPDEIFHMDYKPYSAAGKSLAVAQVASVSQSELHRLRELMIPYLKNLLPNSGLDMLFLMLTNIIDETTELLFVGAGTEEIVRAAFHRDCEANSVVLPGVVSRKKQMMSPLIGAIENAAE
ncbi:MAG TPA: putative manganese-dependent inorganic diphosphatase [Candidatus Onthomonas avicola]|nr:putative manganese-dependent inorganic diphosphatase [Candidatus Onthomonas avicola]